MDHREDILQAAENVEIQISRITTAAGNVTDSCKELVIVVDNVSSVVEIDQHDIGLVVDGVTKALRIPGSAVEPPSSVITSIESSYLRGIAKLKERLIILLNLNQILDRMEGDSLRNMAHKEASGSVAA